MSKKNPSPPSAKPTPTLLEQYKGDGTYGAVYGDANPWVQWIKKAKHHLVLTLRPTMRAKPHGVRGSRPPRCPACREPMRPLNGGWRCINARIQYDLVAERDVFTRCNILLPVVVTIGPIVVRDEDGKRINPADLANRPIDIVWEREAYRARAVIR